MFHNRRASLKLGSRAFLFGLLINFGVAKIFTRCELVKILVLTHNLTLTEAAKWICLANFVSSFNSSQMEKAFSENSTRAYYGIFRIGNTFWCSDSESGVEEGGCGLPCKDFLNDDLFDDIEYAPKMYNEAQGFGPWNFSLSKNCELEKLRKYLSTCPGLRNYGPPKILGSENGPQLRSFQENSQNQRLVCIGTGTPKPSMIWEYNKTRFYELYTSTSSSGEIVLHFPKVTQAHSGTYTCRASSLAGDDVVHFVVGVFGPEAPGFVFGLMTGMILSILLIGLALIVYKRLCASVTGEKPHRTGLSRKEIEEFEFGDPESLIFNAFAHENAKCLPYDKDYEILDEDLQIETSKILGAGAYGLVMRGIIEGTPVAVKTVKPTADKTYLKALLSELKIMIYLGPHPNIVQLIGAKTKKLTNGSLFIVVEYCALGSLESYLRAHRDHYQNWGPSTSDDPLEPQYVNETASSSTDLRISNEITYHDLIRWCYEMASGMQYLESKKVIHGDLATRNLLLTEQKNVKLTDFGLSKQLYDYTNYVKKQQAPLPWRWMAIESIRELTFSHQSDVWSFGVTVWEIFTFAEVPYAGLSWSLDFQNQLENGLRLPKPKLASDAMYQKMLECWNLSPNLRPEFGSLVVWCSKMRSSESVPIQLT